MSLKEIIIKKEDEGLRVEQLIRKYFKNLSKKASRSFLASGNVILNGKKPKKGDRVKQGDVLLLDSGKVYQYTSNFIPHNENAPFLDVLYKDQWLMALNKPSGIHTAPLRRGDHLTVVSAAINIEPSISNVAGWQKREAGLIYRLDREVSGIVLFALKNQIFSKFIELTNNNKVFKYYLGIIENLNPHTTHSISGTFLLSSPRPAEKRKKVIFENIEFYPHMELEKSINKFTKNADKIEDKNGIKKINRNYLMQVKTLKRSNNLALVLIKLTKAFRHQIRSVFSTIGKPIYGDILYNSTIESEEIKNQIFLHLWKVRFPHPVTEKEVVIISNPERLFCSKQTFNFKSVIEKYE